MGNGYKSFGKYGIPVTIGAVVGASFYDDEKDEPRKTPRLSIDMDEDIPVGHYRVYIIEVTENEKGNTTAMKVSE